MLSRPVRQAPRVIARLASSEAASSANEGAKKSLDFLGVDNVIFGDNYCCRFDSLDILDLVKQIELIIQQEKPSHIFTHNPIEVNIDHRLTYDAVEVASRPKKHSHLKSVYSFEIVCSGNWKFEKTFSPNTYVDISKYFKIGIIKRISGALIGAFIFFVVTNFGVWLLGSYEYSLNGLIICYTLAIPFFSYTLVSTLIFSTIIETILKFVKTNLKISI